MCDRGSAAYWTSLQIPVISSAHPATPVLSGRHRGSASLVFSHRGSASQRISAARKRIARIFASLRVPQKEVGKRSSITFFVFGTLLVTFRSLFLTLLSLFPSLFCQTPFAGLLLRQGESHRIAISVFNTHRHSHRIAARIERYGPPSPCATPIVTRGPLDIFETPVTVTPQQEISKTLNSSKIP